MRIHDKTARRLAGTALVLSLAALAAPQPLTAQDPPPERGEQQEAQDSTVGPEEMTRFVTLQLAIDSLQEEAVLELAAIHSESGRAQIRSNLTQAIAAAYEEHGMTEDRYETVTFLISSDTAARDLFESTLAEVRGEGGDEAAGGGGG